MHTEIVSLLETDPDISALVSDRVWLLKMKQGNKETCITYFVIGGVPEQTSGGMSELSDAVLTLILWSQDSMELWNLREAVVSLWNGYQGQVGDLSINNATPSVVVFDHDDESGFYRYVISVELNLRN